MTVARCGAWGKSDCAEPGCSGRGEGGKQSDVKLALLRGAPQRGSRPDTHPLPAPRWPFISDDTVLSKVNSPPKLSIVLWLRHTSYCTEETPGASGCLGCQNKWPALHLLLDWQRGQSVVFTSGVVAGYLSCSASRAMSQEGLSSTWMQLLNLQFAPHLSVYWL